jgi:hypothetical protein
MLWSQTHKTRWVCRTKIAGLLLMVYMSITLTPLAPLAMHSKPLAHEVTGECTGDCDICGCSQASRSSQTCCCARKKQQQSILTAATDGDCCAASRQEQGADHGTNVPARGETVFKCSCPCDSGKQFSLAGAGISEILPFFYAESIHPFPEDENYLPLVKRMTSRHAEPPDPPPRLSNLS